MSTAVLEAPFRVAEIVAVAFELTFTVLTVKVAEDLPAGIVTDWGTAADEAVLDGSMTRPPIGAAEVIVTVPVLVLPPTTVVGLKLNDFREGAVIVSAADAEIPFRLAEIVNVLWADTATVFIVNIAEVFPAATATVDGTVADGTMLVSLTMSPPVLAAPPSVALEWRITSGQTERGLALVANAPIVMGMLGLDSCSWLTRMLALEVQDRGSVGRIAAPRTACWAYGGAGFGVSRVQARKRALVAVEELAELARAREDLAHLGWALARLGLMLFPQDPERAQSTLLEALELNAELNDRATETFIVTTLAWLAAYRRGYGEATSLADQAFEMAKARSDNNMISGVGTLQGYIAKEQGLSELARLRLEEARNIALASRSDYAVRCASQLLAELYIDSGGVYHLSEELTRATPGTRQHADWLSTDQVDMISRYLAAQETRYRDAADGLSELIASFVRIAKDLPSPEYRWAGLGLEVKAQCVAAAARKKDAATMFGAAQAMIERDAVTVSPSIRICWDRLQSAAGLIGDEPEVIERRALSANEALSAAEHL